MFISCTNVFYLQELYKTDFIHSFKQIPKGYNQNTLICTKIVCLKIISIAWTKTKGLGQWMVILVVYIT